MSRSDMAPLVGLLALAGIGAGLLNHLSGREPVVAEGQPAPRTGMQQDNVRLVYRTELGESADAPEGAKNVVIVQTCALRRDTLATWGGPEDILPTVDAMAKRGAWFSDALTAATWSRPSTIALLTGQHALERALVEPGVAQGTVKLPEDALTLAEHLYSQGWYTMGVNASPLLRQDNTQLWQGVSFLRDAHPRGWQTEPRLDASEVVVTADRLINQARNKGPFYLHLVLTDTHKPIRVSTDETKAMADRDLPSPAYYAAAKRLDDGIAQLQELLADKGLAEDTYIVVIGDHGEGLNRPPEHGPSHGRYLAPSSVQVPWLVVGGDIAPGTEVQGVASTIDLPATITGLLGADPFPTEGGVDWSNALRGETQRVDRDAVITDSWYLNVNRAAIWTQNTMCQRDFGTEGRDQLYADGCFDRQTDPDHLTPGPVDDALVSRIGAWRAEHPLPEPAEGTP